MMDLKPHASLTNALTVLLKLTIVVTGLAILIGFYEFYAYSTFAADVVVDDLLPADIISGLTGLVQFGLVLATNIIFFWWVHRSNTNLRALSGESLEFTPGWSVGWFFVPFANLWKPYQVMKEIWQVSHRGATDAQPVVVWWALYLVSSALGRVAFRYTMGANDAGGYATASVIFIISDAVDVVLSIAELIMVTRIGVAYTQNFDETATEWLNSFD